MALADLISRIFRRSRSTTATPVLPVPAPEIEATTILGKAIAASIKQYMFDARARGYQTDPAIHLGITSLQGQRTGLLSYDDMRRMYQRNGIIRAVVDTKLNQILSSEWTIQKAPNLETRFVPIWKIERATELFRKPSKYRSYEWMMQEFLRDYLVLDSAAIEVVSAPDGVPVKLVPLDAATIRPKIEPHGELLGYIQKVPGILSTVPEVEFAPEELIYVQGHPSTDTIWSLAPLESLAIEVGSYLYAMKYNADQFTQGNMADNLLVVVGEAKQALTDLDTWFEANRGKGWMMPHMSLPAGQPGVGATLLKLNPNIRDMAFIEWLWWLLQVCCAVFQVEPNQVIQRASFATKASAEEQSTVHQEKGVFPELAIIAAAFTGVVSRFHSALVFTFSEGDKLDDVDEASVHSTLFNSGVPINELRKREGKEPLEGPVVTFRGEEFCIYDLPINPQTGLPIGFELFDEGALANSLDGGFGPPTGTDPSSLQPSGGSAGRGLPWQRKKIAKAGATGRRQQPHQTQERAPIKEDAPAAEKPGEGPAPHLRSPRGADARGGHPHVAPEAGTSCGCVQGGGQ